MNQVISKGNAYLRYIVVVSIVVPMTVAFLLFVPLGISVTGDSWVRSLPALNAIINSTTTLLLVAALIAIKLKRVVLHRNLMTLALILGTLFLISYILYHASVESTIFGDTDHNGILEEAELEAIGRMRSVYLFTLLSHIAFSVIVVPLVLFAFYYALSGQFERHKKLVRFTLPVWLYVSVTGVLVYLMISPYYV